MTVNSASLDNMGNHASGTKVTYHSATHDYHGHVIQRHQNGGRDYTSAAGLPVYEIQYIADTGAKGEQPGGAEPVDMVTVTCEEGPGHGQFMVD